jgi:hypothetical protein
MLEHFRRDFASILLWFVGVPVDDEDDTDVLTTVPGGSGVAVGGGIGVGGAVGTVVEMGTTVLVAANASTVMQQILAAVVLDDKEHTRNQMTLMVVMLHEEADLTLRITMPELIGISCD